jgi:hypothetical protein
MTLLGLYDKLFLIEVNSNGIGACRPRIAHEWIDIGAPIRFFESNSWTVAPGPASNLG